MPHWVAAMPEAELWPGELRGLVLAGTRVALVNLHGSVHAYLDRCPHLGLPISRGTLEGDVVTCAGHGYLFRADSGRGVNPERCALTALPIRIEEGRIMVDLEGIARAGEA
jgi:toluene monooxygenase system ferredoxin subunit